jgi:leucyl-tRNA synthetase
MHLLYARFFTKALRNCGYIDLGEPFEGLLTQGMICHRTFKDSFGNWLAPDDVEKIGEKWLIKSTGDTVTAGRIEKMSKSKKNTIDPSYMISKYGADSVRLFLLSDSPPSRDIEWSDEGIEGSYRYLSSLYKFVVNFIATQQKHTVTTPEKELNLKKFLHKSIASITADIENLALNKAIANIRTLSNELFTSNVSANLTREVIETILQLIFVFTPHIAMELWKKLGNKMNLNQVDWPLADKQFLNQDTVNVAVQINGKTRGIVELAYNCSKDDVLQVVKDMKILDKYLANTKIKKLIHVKNRIINFVI